jgi:hypothetical protein
VSYKANPDGSRSPYELNIAYVDAVAQPGEDEPQHIARFLLSQAVMLSLKGIPAIYIHSLLGSRNDRDGLERLGYARAINRAKLDVDVVQAELLQPDSFRARVFKGYTHLLQTRLEQAAFHPQGTQRAFELQDGRIFGLERLSPDHTERVFALFNMTSDTSSAHLKGGSAYLDLLTGERLTHNDVPLTAYQVRWLSYDGQ